MPLKRDEKGGGTNADGTRSTIYCSHCFEGGCFKDPGMTAAQMQDLVKGKLKGFGFPGFMAVFLTKRIPRLKRGSP